ncbi:MAG: putative F420-dependent oxidoreductase [Gammaproteobacteria bacterium]|jgi:probable F420-dependent oxidoreductase
MKTRFAITPPASVLNEVNFPNYVVRVEQLGFDTLWLSDIPLGTLGDPIVALAFAAAKTSRLKLGANIVPLGRNPLWIAKQLAQIDRLSHGRVLVSLVPGLGQPGERAALGYAKRDRGKAIEGMMDLLRRWWDGEAVTAEFEDLHFDDVQVSPRPLQQPLEIWLGGKSNIAIDRVARCADGWLTAAMTPDEAARACAEIAQRAQGYNRCVDAEHFGISMPYSVGPPCPESVAALQQRRKDADVSEILALGSDGLVERIQAYQAAGLSKFVVRPLNPSSNDGAWSDELDWLAETILPLQT